MKKAFALLFLIPTFLYSQAIYRSIESTNLNQTRKFKIWLPRNYAENVEKSYPIILVLDGDYLFEPVAGDVSYYSYSNEMPESIVVGVNQAGFHPADVFHGQQTSFFTTESKSFYDFLKDELLQYIKKTYRTSDFEVIVGHGRTSSFINKFLIQDPQLFEAFVNLSPAFEPEVREKVVKKLPSIKRNIWYYLATGSEDFDLIRKDAMYFKAELGPLTKENLHIYFDKFEGENHYTMVGFGIAAALEKIFSPYGPILKKEYQKIIQQKGGYCEYLLKKYEKIDELYNVELKIKTNDLMAIAAAIKENEKWGEYEQLSIIAGRNYPGTMLPGYFKAVFYERTGKPKLALRTYRKAYTKKEISFLTKELIWDRIEQLKLDFGY